MKILGCIEVVTFWNWIACLLISQSMAWSVAHGVAAAFARLEQSVKNTRLDRFRDDAKFAARRRA
jgi:hypothetical protein